MSSEDVTTQIVSRRVATRKQLSSFLTAYSEAVSSNPYSILSPKGICNLGEAENKLVEGMVHSRLQSGTCNEWKRHFGYYGQEVGACSLEYCVANFLSVRLKAAHPIEPDKVVCLNGVTSIFNALALTLADPGDYFLSPSPYYPAIPFDVGAIAQVQVYGIPLTSKLEEGDSQPFQLTVAKIERAYTNALKEDFGLSGLRCGIVYSRSQDVLAFLKATGLMTSVPRMIKNMHRSLISEPDWLDTIYFPTNKKRMAHNYKLCCKKTA